MDFSAVMNLVLGSGLVATIIAIITLKSTVREARGESGEGYRRSRDGTD
ncbi:hypothetical protein NXW11_24785 [Bacteroides thetaiotaomicron]|nr:hypothetical protein [Bacteroides thetaiotaomicron]